MTVAWRQRQNALLLPQRGMKEHARETMFFGPDGIAINLIQQGTPVDAKE